MFSAVHDRIARHSRVLCYVLHHSTGQRSEAQHNTIPKSTLQWSSVQHNKGQHNALLHYQATSHTYPCIPLCMLLRKSVRYRVNKNVGGTQCGNYRISRCRNSKQDLEFNFRFQNVGQSWKVGEGFVVEGFNMMMIVVALIVIKRDCVTFRKR